MDKNNYKLSAFVRTHVGKVRNNNEDNFLFLKEIVDDTQTQLSFDGEEHTEKVCLFGVFDGMGGHEFGEKASMMTAQLARDFIFDEQMIEEGLNQICLQANFLVCEEMKRLKQRLGTTASMLAFYKKHVAICNIGDTPIYLYRNKELIPLYEEHTERRMYEKIYGKTDPKKKYRLTQNIGIFEQEMMIKPYVNTIAVFPGDYFLIASDGLTDMVSTQEIASLLGNENALELLEKKALENGGRDNITMILVHIEKKTIFDFFK